MLHHVLNNLEATFWVVKVLVLDTSLDNIERGGDEKRSRCSGNRSNKVLEPRSLVVILQTEEVTLGES